MLKKSMKIVSVLMAIMLVVALTSTVFAASYSGWDSYTPSAQDSTGASESIANMSNTILSIVQVVGMAVAVIMLIVLAIKYISAAPSDKAEIKKHAVVYVVGAVVLFGASGILAIVRQFAKNIKTA